MAAITKIIPRSINTTGNYVVASIEASANVVAGNIKSDHLLYANGSPYVFTTNAAGTNTQVQFNDGNSFAGSANLTFDKVSNTLTVAYFSGNGHYLTDLIGTQVTGEVAYANRANSVAGANVTGQVSNSLVAGTVYTNTQPNITSVGTLTSLSVSGDGSVGGNFTITGNLIVSGTQTSVNSTTVNINDINLVLANNATTAAQANGGGITINGANATILYNSTSNAVVFSHLISANGALLTSVTGANVTGTVANATYAITSGAADTASTANAVAGANVSGQVGNALIAGTVYTNAQPNITSVGTLTSLDVTGNITTGNANLGNAVTANFFTGNGHYLTSLLGTQVAGEVAFANVANSVAGANVSGTVANATYAVTAGTANSVAGANVSGTVANATYATTAGTANSVAVANVSGIGNIATINLDGNAGNILFGNGVFASPSASSYNDSNVATYLPTYTGNLTPNNLTVTTYANLGDVGNVVITGGSTGQLLTTDGSGNLSWSTVTGGSSTTESTVTSVDTFNGDGTTVTFTLSVTPQTISQTFVNYNGALQLRGAYTLSGQDITFSEAPANGSVIEVTTQMGVTSGSGNLVVRTYTANGSQTTYAVSAGVNVTNILVTENGLLQTPTTDYTISGSTLTFTTAPGAGVKVQIRELGIAIATITPAGSNTQVLYNDAGSFGHSSGFVFDKTTSTLTANNIISGNLVPRANTTYNLGSPTMSWKDLYLSGNTLYLGGAHISVDDTSGAVKITPAATVANPTPTAQVISSPRYITMVKTGNITTPDTGTSRYYPPKDVTISNVLASLSTAATSNLQFTINKNGSNTGAYTISANAYQLTKTVANISLTTSDYLTVNILSGEGAAELRLDLEYTDA